MYRIKTDIFFGRLLITTMLTGIVPTVSARADDDISREPYPLLDKIKTASETIIDDITRSTYSVTALSGELPQGAVRVTIDDNPYYFTPDTAAHSLSDWQNLSNTGSLALTTSDTGSTPVLKKDTTDYYYDKTKLPVSSYSITKVTPSDIFTFTKNIINAEGEKETAYYKVDLKLPTGKVYTITKNDLSTDPVSFSIAAYQMDGETRIEKPENFTISLDLEKLKTDTLSWSKVESGGIVIKLPTNNLISRYAYTDDASRTSEARTENPTDSIGSSSRVLYSELTSADKGGAIYNDNNSTMSEKNINADFISNNATEKGGAIYNDNGDIGSITGSFISNTTQDSGYGAGIYNDTGSHIGDITGDFINNRMANGGNGGAIYNGGASTIDTITGNFIQSIAQYGAAIENIDNSFIGSITGDFIVGQAPTRGGAIDNYNNSHIGSITGDFIKNYAGYRGSAINNAENSVIDTITGDFIINYTKSNGGAISNENSHIGIITANFIDNMTDLDGGAIENYAGTIDTITGDFISNSATSLGGAIYNTRNATINAITGDFISNSATSLGGAIYNDSVINGNNAIIDNINGNFTSNSAEFGGAVYNTRKATINTITGNFTSNSAELGGGAIYVDNAKINTITGNFDYNTSEIGGAFYNTNALIDSITGDFTENTALLNPETPYGFGGAIANYRETFIGTITGNFTSNSATSGGAIYNNNNATINTLTGDFASNSAKYGGAIYNFNNAAINTIAGDFTSNSAETSGGAIYNDGSANENDAIIDNINGNFTSNSAETGGAIFNTRNATINATTGDFISNSATENGGAIYNNNNATINAITGNFTANSAGYYGGALFNVDAAQTTFIAKDGKDITFAGNYVTDATGVGGAIVNALDSTVNLYAEAGRKITFTGESSITGAREIDSVHNEAILNINGDGVITPYTGTINLASVTNGDATTAFGSNEGTTNIYGGTVNIKGDFDQNTLNLSSGTLNVFKNYVTSTTNIAPDSIFNVDYTGNNTFNTVSFGALTLGSNIAVALKADLANEEMDKIKATSATGNGKINISAIRLLSDSADSKNKVSLDIFADNATKTALQDKVTGSIKGISYSSRYKYDAEYNTNTGQFDFTRIGSNPVINVPAVATEAVYLSRLNTYKQVFNNVFPLTASARRASLLRNQFASGYGADVASDVIFDRISTDRTTWLRPYGSFEKVSLKNASRIDNDTYGLIGGKDSTPHDLKNGWNMVYGGYAAYNGSHQNYDDINIYQNGAMIGGTLAFYKGGFFSGITANTDISFVRAHASYGNDDMKIFGVGIANETGYNYEAISDSFVITPSVMTSYSYIDVFGYKSANGDDIKSDGVNIFEVEPKIKLTGMFGDGWQTYTGVGYVWNFMDSSEYTINSEILPEVSSKPYFEYTLGISKEFTSVTSDFELIFRTGGRKGVALKANFRF